MAAATVDKYVEIDVVGDILVIRVIDLIFTNQAWRGIVNRMNALLRSYGHRDFDAVVDVSACTFVPVDVVTKVLSYLRTKWDVLGVHLRSWVLLTSSSSVRAIVESTSALLCEKRLRPRTLNVNKHEDERGPHCNIGVTAWSAVLATLHANEGGPPTQQVGDAACSL